MPYNHPSWIGTVPYRCDPSVWSQMLPRPILWGEAFYFQC